MSSFNRIVIFGATSVIAQHIARELLTQGTRSFVLIGRNQEKLTEVKADLVTRAVPEHIDCECLICDLLDPRAVKEVTTAALACGVPDLCLIAQGSSLPETAVLQSDLKALHDNLTLNAISPALCAEAMLPALMQRKSGTLAIIGSMAGDRGRASNYPYGAAKACLDTYAQGLRHRCYHTGVKICLIKPGRVRSPLTAVLEHPGPLAEPSEVARTVVKDLLRVRSVIYVPSLWRYIMFAVRLMPGFIFNRLSV